MAATNPLSCAEWAASRVRVGRPKPSPFEADEWLRYQREVRSLERHVLSSVVGPAMSDIAPPSMQAAEHAPPRPAAERAAVTPSLTAKPTPPIVQFEASPVTFAAAVPTTPAAVTTLQRSSLAFTESELTAYYGALR